MMRPAALLLAVALAGCGAPPDDVSEAEARAFLAAAEARLLEHWVAAGRADWVRSTYITADTNTLSSAANARLMAATTELATEAARFDTPDLPPDLARKLNLLKTSLAAVAPADPALQRELAGIMTEMEANYGRGEYCPPGGDCLDLTAMERRFASVRDTDELLGMWLGWREVAQPVRPLYERFVEVSNTGARELGFDDLGALWRARYELPAGGLAAELERLWLQVRPLYEALHCHVRARLGEEFGTAVVAPGEPIPAHLLGNMWAQSWTNVYETVGPSRGGPGYDLTRLLQQARVDARGMVRYGERFFSSLGFEPLPATFWERSLFVRPADRDVVCHASAWNLDFESDVRIKMCIGVNDEDFVTIHHELGHNYYQRAYSGQDPLYRNSANDGFHEGIGDTVALSITPEYLARVGLLGRVPDARGDIGLLLQRALDKVAFLPFGLLVDQWRWQVFSGAIAPADYNTAWWELRERYQGVRPAAPRTAQQFDPGAKYHVPANTPYTRYFIAHILQFQFHRALCAAAGFDGPLHRCSIFESDAAGRRLRAMLELGASQPWPDALEVIAGTREMDATAILDYFAPLAAWLEEQNAGRACGW